jgi:cytochrome c oxidase subunit 4
MPSRRSLFFVWFALLALLSATVAASFLLRGGPSLATSLGIALAKGALVVWFFMNLRREGHLVRLAAAGAIVVLLIFLFLVSTDYGIRGGF